MKRIAKKSPRKLTPEENERLRQLREQIDREERGEIIAKGKLLFKQRRAAEVELSRAAELLQAERQSQGLSLSKLQERTGIGRAALCRLENLVDANPTIDTLNRIAEALGKQLVIGLQDKATS
jgi:DNA-binding phage protein